MGEYYYCLAHSKVEGPGECPAAERLGPYPTKEAALAWRETAAQRSERWDAEDERWNK
jgi:hypothetical protein